MAPENTLQRHRFRARLLAGELLVGTIVTLPAPEAAELLAKAGFDWLFIDAEHAPLSAGQMQGLLQAAGPETPCLIRLATAGEVQVKQALDIGAAGIIVPRVNTAEQAAQIVRWSKYAPQGSRAVGISRAHHYGLGFQEYMAAANEETAVVIQAEHIDAANNIESILEVPGIDAVLVGPYDLSASLGKPGQVEDEEVTAAIHRISEACLRAGVRLGIFGATAAAVQPYIERGFTLITASTDALLLGQAAVSLVGALRG